LSSASLAECTVANGRDSSAAVYRDISEQPARGGIAGPLTCEAHSEEENIVARSRRWVLDLDGKGKARPAGVLIVVVVVEVKGRRENSSAGAFCEIRTKSIDQAPARYFVCFFGLMRALRQCLSTLALTDRRSRILTLGWAHTAREFLTCS